MHYKKELGLSLNEIKSADWFKQLDENEQKYALGSVKATYTPPNNMEETLLNITLHHSGWEEEWATLCARLFPWGNPIQGGAEIGLAKRAFFTRKLTGGKGEG